MDVLFAALAEAILGLIVEDISQRSSIAKWRDRLHGDNSEKLSLQKALLRAYNDFAYEYHDLASAFLDEHFLFSKPVIAEIAKSLTPHDGPNTEYLATLWYQQFSSAPVFDVRGALAFLLDRIVYHIKSEPLLQSFSNARNFEDTAKFSKSIARSTNETSQKLDETNEILKSIHIEISKLMASLSLGKLSLSKKLQGDWGWQSKDAEKIFFNPFIDLGRINDPSRFFGRQRELRELSDLLRRGNSISLVGESEVGKSSILFHLRNTQKSWQPPHQVEYLNLQSVVDEKDFCTEVLHLLQYPGSDLVHLKRALRQKSCILFLDELERLLQREFKPRLQNMLRSLVEDRHLILLVSSQRHITDILPPVDSTSPLHNIFVPYELGPFTNAEVHAFIEHRLQGNNVHFTLSEIEHLITLSACNPGRLQRAANELFNSKVLVS